MTALVVGLIVVAVLLLQALWQSSAVAEDLAAQIEEREYRDGMIELDRNLQALKDNRRDEWSDD